MLYWCVRQRSGPLVKECRAIRPRFGAADDSRTRAEKAAILRPRLCAVSRRPADRLEIRLAVFGFDGIFYTLTYRDAPEKFQDVRRDLRNFLGWLRRRAFGEGTRERGQPFDYAYCIEGKHSRWHVHLILRRSEFPPGAVVSGWSGHGFVDDEPLLRKDGGFWRIAEYLNKERRGGVLPVGSHPWSVSRSVLRQVPPVERWRDECGEIAVPPDAAWVGPRMTLVNNFGEYRYASWIEAEPGRVLT